MDERNKVWPDWKTVRIIGKGSFGTVYEIERDVFGHLEKAALKVISIPQSSSDIEDLYNDGYDEASITQRFESYLKDIVREYSLMAEMKGCNNIVYCDDLRYIQHDDGMGWDIYIKMELLESLPKVLERDFSEKQIIKLGLDMCNALVVCKGKNIVHRDIKPQNIFVAEDGTYKLGDFGIAKTAERTTSGTKTGTYKYMAPEVYNNQPYGSAADIYSLGLVLYWLLNERRTPFLPLPPQVPSASAEDEARKKRFDGEPILAPAHGSKELKTIVLKACAFEPSARYASAADMRRDLERLYYGRPLNIEEATESKWETTPPGESIGAETDSDDTGTVGAFGGKDQNGTVIALGSGGEENTGKHRIKKIMLLLLGAVIIILVLKLGLHLWYHQWTDATCTEPQRCTICGKVDTKALGHDWIPATCTEQQYCNTCGATGESTLGHQWVNATTTTPKTCSVCGKTEGAPLNPYADLTVGDVFTIGNYEQDSNSGNGTEKIEWMVLDKKVDKILAISRYALDCQRYHRQNESVSWSNCSVRIWLNSTFYNAAFNPTEKEYLLNKIGDIVFLLSLEELNDYYSSNSSRICRATSYAIAQNAYVNPQTGGSWWLLRTPGDDGSKYVMSVNSDGMIDYDGGKVASDRGTIRPAIWISTE